MANAGTVALALATILTLYFLFIVLPPRSEETLAALKLAFAAEEASPDEPVVATIPPVRQEEVTLISTGLDHYCQL